LRANGVSLAPLLGILFFKLRERPQEDATLGADNEALRRSEERYRTVVESAKDYAPSASIPRAASLTGPHRRLVRSAAAVFRQHPIAPRQKPLLEKPVDMAALGMALEKASGRRRIWQDQG
jgi:hypothetical protein